MKDNGRAIKLAESASKYKTHDTHCNWDNINNRDKRGSDGLSPKLIGLIILLFIALALGRVLFETPAAEVPASMEPTNVGRLGTDEL